MIALPVTPKDCRARIVAPALAALPEALRTPRAQVLLIAIALQESGLAARRQIGGPARGLWQFEVSGVRAVQTHPASRAYMPREAPDALQARLETDDLLACRVARLLLYTLPDPLPALGDYATAWAQYLAAWRPGRPRPEPWQRNCTRALESIP